MEARTPNPPSAPRGWRIDRVPSKPVEREVDGRLAIHLWLQQDGKFDGDLALRLSPDEAEMLHAQLCYALNAEPGTTPTERTPDCRKTGGGSPGVRWP